MDGSTYDFREEEHLEKVDICIPPISRLFVLPDARCNCSAKLFKKCQHIFIRKK